MRCLLLVASLLLSIFSFAQPSNDDCANALVIPISPNGACSTEINGTTVGATPSAVAACVGTAEDDIWFKFTATKTEHVVSWFIQTAITQPVIEVFSGACGALVSIKCSERAVLPWLVQDIVTNLTVGQDYYVRIYDKDAASPRSPVKMCVYEPPVNDDCTGAILTTINTDTSWTNFTQASFQYSTASGPFCGSVLNNGDVWYKFVASDSIHLLQIKLAASNFNNGFGVQFYEGSCGSLVVKPIGYFSSDNTGVNCLSPVVTDGYQVLRGLAPGNTYYLRFMYNKDRYLSLNFSFALSHVAPNDICDNAVVVPVNAGNDCIQKVQGDYQNSVGQVIPGSPCAAPGPNVWYKFTATSSRHIVSAKFFFLSGGLNDFDVWTGTCGSLASVNCKTNMTGDVKMVELTALVPGNDYYIRMITPGNQTKYYHWPFELCITTPGLGLVNDDCAGALPLLADANNYTLGSVVGFTPSPVPVGICNWGGRDIWYQFTPAFNASVSVKYWPISNGEVDDVAVAVFSGACGSQTFMVCNNTGTAQPGVAFNGIAGQPYYIRVSGTVPPATTNAPFLISVAALNPLPVTLRDFRISRITEKSIGLSWQTTQESGIRTYYIQRSVDGTTFTNTGSVPARNQASNDYAFTDNQPLTGRNYYRLKIVDVDDKVEYSKIIDARLKGSGSFSIYAAQNSIRIVNEKSTSVHANLGVYDAMGRLLSKEDVVLRPGTNTFNRPAVAGIVFVHLSTAEGTIVSKLTW